MGVWDLYKLYARNLQTCLVGKVTSTQMRKNANRNSQTRGI